MSHKILHKVLHDICAQYDNNQHRMMDVLLDVQRCLKCIDGEAMNHIASLLGCTRIEVEGVVSFYSFFSDTPKGNISIYLCDDIIDRQAGLKKNAKAFEDALGICFGQTTPDGEFSLDYTPCIGMSDQAPAAMVNDIILPNLTPESIHLFIQALRAGTAPEDLDGVLGDGNNAHDLLRSQVHNNIQVRGDVLLCEVGEDAGLHKSLSLAPADIIEQIVASDLRGYGGAGFSTGDKWGFATATQDTERYVFCNADEGEPGTFKDRVLLTERPDLLIEGMTIAGRAIGSEYGLIYLRGEYVYLKPWLEHVLEARRQKGVLGKDIGGLKGFDFDIRIQMGAGAYICGEESAMISSCEGLPGEPKTRPPFPTEKGYFGHPTIVNNVETFCHVARIMDRGARWFHAIGTSASSGTKLLSICGDCSKPGVYEVPYGISVQELLEMSGAKDICAVQVGGPSGHLIARNEFNRKICFEDLPTGGSIMVFASTRNILEIVDYFLEFFVDESCGFCTPCRVGNVFLKERIGKIRKGHAVPEDIDYLKELSNTIIKTSRCGLGQTSPNPVLSSLNNFPLVYSALVNENEDGLDTNFNIQDALEESRHLAKHRSYIYDPDFGEG
ncbi:MAG: NADH:ubiquinone oxidoreductase [Rhodospirillaceae bacterium]|nr:MAG: NADH:ubiquinone oxidoreductase [Rhodospirillaceae bacterium]